MLALFLRNAGLDVDTACDGSDALDYLHTHRRPDVVLLDMGLPRCDGATVVRKVRWDDRGPEELQRALLALASDPGARQALGIAFILTEGRCFSSGILLCRVDLLCALFRGFRRCLLLLPNTLSCFTHCNGSRHLVFVVRVRSRRHQPSCPPKIRLLLGIDPGDGSGRHAYDFGRLHLLCQLTNRVT